MGKLHPDFEKAAERRRWTGPLKDLGETLKKAAFRAEGAWVDRVLPHGAIVASRFHSVERSMRHQVGIGRSEAPKDDAARKKWAQELATFEKHLGLEGYYREPSAKAPDRAVQYTRLFAGEIRPGIAKCIDCPKEIPFEPVFGPNQRCNGCAIVAGRRERAVPR